MSDSIFITKDTIEEALQKRQRKKLQLADTVLDNPSAETIQTIATLGENENEIRELLAARATRQRAPKRKLEGSA